jgi:hypothetical protein
MRELEIEGNNYRIGKLNPFEQFHIVRRVAPVLVSLGEIQSKMQKIENGEEPDEGLFAKFGGLANIVSQMPDDDVDYVLKLCLRVAKRIDSNGNAPVLSPSGKLMYEDINMTVMLKIAFETIDENLGGFMKGADQSLPQASHVASSSR